MKKSIPTVNHDPQTFQGTKKKVTIMRYYSSVATTNSKIELLQNLFSFLIEGNKSVQYAGTKVTINPSQFLLLSTGNCLMTEKIAAESGGYKSILIFFDRELLTNFLIRHNRLPQPVRSTQMEPFLVFKTDDFLANFINSLGFILDSGQTLTDELQSLKLEELLIYLNGRFPDVIQKLHAAMDEQGDSLIRQAVMANIFNAITVEELAFLCCMSLSTFKRRFAKIYGSSPNKWLLQKRMERAAQMLELGESKASDIYLELGYENLSSFIHSFKQVYGTTPKQYQLNRLDV
jgi:AraC-like DNA-binding protein